MSTFYWFCFLGLLVVFFKLSTSQKCAILNQSLSQTISEHQAAYSSQTNTIYVFGGRGGTEYFVYKWNLSLLGSWFEQIGATPSQPFWSPTQNSVLINDTIYFVGIRDSYPIITGSIYRFHIPTESWLNLDLAVMTHPLDFGCLATNQSHLFIFEGTDDADGDPTGHPFLQIYDISKNLWTVRNLNASYSWRYQYCSFTNNNLFVFGGYSDKHNMHKYDMNGQQLVNIGHLSVEMMLGRAVEYNNLLYLVGNEPYDNRIAIFDVNSETLTNKCLHMNINVSKAAAVIIDDTLYIIGGSSSGGRTDKVQICDLNDIIEPCYPTPMPTDYPTAAPVTSSPTANTLPPSTINPTALPTTQPTSNPTQQPATNPTAQPTAFPTDNPTDQPIPQTTPNITQGRTKDPTLEPTSEPTLEPTVSQSTSTETPLGVLTIYPATNTPIGSEVSEPVNSESDSADTTVFEEYNPKNESETAFVLIISIVGAVVGCCVLIFCIVFGYKIRNKTKRQTDEEYMQSDKVMIGNDNMQSNVFRNINYGNRNIEMGNLMNGTKTIPNTGDNIITAGGDKEYLRNESFVVTGTLTKVVSIIEGGGENIIDNNEQDFIQAIGFNEQINNTPYLAQDEFVIDDNDRTRQYSEGVQ